MPGGDGTGPMGTGGWCTPLWMGGQIPRPMGGRFGRGFGWRRWRFAPIMPTQPYQVWEPVQMQPQAYQPTKEQEMQMLENESKAIEQEQEALKQELEEVRKRIAELKRKK